MIFDVEEFVSEKSALPVSMGSNATSTSPAAIQKMDIEEQKILASSVVAKRTAPTMMIFGGLFLGGALILNNSRRANPHIVKSVLMYVAGALGVLRLGTGGIFLVGSNKVIRKYQDQLSRSEGVEYSTADIESMVDQVLAENPDIFVVK